MAPNLLNCPSCFDGGSLRRSHHRWHDLPFRLIGMKAYRCMTCYRRFHTWRKVVVRPRSERSAKPA